jgi:predicted aconitase with swiveling domain
VELTKVILKGRRVSKGTGQGYAVVSSEPISFLGGIDRETGTIREKTSGLKGTSIAKKVFVFPTGKGSTGGSMILFGLAEKKKGPAAILNAEADTITAVGAILGGIPMIDRFDRDPVSLIKNGDFVKVDAEKGIVEIMRNEDQAKGNRSIR